MRQDAWTQFDDDLLTKTVLTHIRINKTQLTAFQEVGKELNRTAAACGFRWNSALRHKYYNEIKAAKEERMNNKKSSIHSASTPSLIQKTDINFMNEIDNAIQALNNLRVEYLNMQEIIRTQNNKITELTIEIQESNKEDRRPIASDDLDTLLKILHRAGQIQKNMPQHKEPAM
ncbi:RsfA family transcriptional regulator [Paenibacillus sp. FSL M7-0802]|uniref:RsfA family transcriptional regulator n=1 Tax=Paenibacillus sp. FSL M7-0802 TaxID=2921536 RepID=UPI0030F8965B